MEEKNIKREPERLCMACRKKYLKKNLIRVAKEKSGKIYIDELKKLHGRGAYVCYNEKCLEILKKKRCLERNFKCFVDKDIYLKLKEDVEKKLRNF